MATGLPTFDAFSWASLLAGRKTLVIDRDAVRCRRVAAALEEAGALATLAPGQAIGADRLRESIFRLVVLGLGGDEEVGDRVAPYLVELGAGLVLMVETHRQAALRLRFPGARIGGHGMSDRDLVMFIIADTDE